MTGDDLRRFADDLREWAGLNVVVGMSRRPDGLHSLTINGVDFFFYADGSGYDGWGKCMTREESGRKPDTTSPT